eukprot:TRINITY_DN36128_c0_g1_i1.p1 TRINITY_DN36128_c0_g1~~TRINITY_DN36128_c0_g1_i1.p1  ORF type:complete len:407 (+),score=65.27 TRINITY_DN36128_c0_g1_i1:180-1400(+)
MASNDKSVPAAARIKEAAMNASKGLSRAQAERAAAAAARNVNAYGQKEEGPSRWQERKEAKRQMYIDSTEKAVILGVRASKAQVISGNQVCQKCYKPGHWGYECKNERVYLSRPSRTQQLKNPRLRPRHLDASELLHEPEHGSLFQANPLYEKRWAVLVQGTEDTDAAKESAKKKKRGKKWKRHGSDGSESESESDSENDSESDSDSDSESGSSRDGERRKRKSRRGKNKGGSENGSGSDSGSSSGSDSESSGSETDSGSESESDSDASSSGGSSDGSGSDSETGSGSDETGSGSSSSESDDCASDDSQSASSGSDSDGKYRSEKRKGGQSRSEGKVSTPEVVRHREHGKFSESIKEWSRDKKAVRTKKRKVHDSPSDLSTSGSSDSEHVRRKRSKREESKRGKRS